MRRYDNLASEAVKKGKLAERLGSILTILGALFIVGGMYLGIEVGGVYVGGIVAIVCIIIFVIIFNVLNKRFFPKDKT